MNLFRSEEHVTRWLEAGGWEPGETIPVQQMCDLAHAWWADRLAPDWRPRTREQSQALLDSHDLRERFWQLG